VGEGGRRGAEHPQAGGYRFQKSSRAVPVPGAGMITQFLPLQARNKAGQVGYVPEKYLLSLGGEPGAGAGPPGPSALHRQLSSIMAAELVLEPGGECWGVTFPGEGDGCVGLVLRGC